MTLEEQLRAAAVAHSIRLGKPAKPGMVLSGTLRVQQIDEAEYRAGRIDKAETVSEPRRVEFVVTAADVANAVQLINEQRAVYRSPKTTTVEVGSEGKEGAVAAVDRAGGQKP